MDLVLERNVLYCCRWESPAHTGKGNTFLVVYSSGSITWIPPRILTTTCKTDLTFFPFDEQECKIKMGSWTYNGFKLDLKMRSDSVDIGTYVVNTEWDLVGATGLKNLPNCK